MSCAKGRSHKLQLRRRRLGVPATRLRALHLDLVRIARLLADLLDLKVRTGDVPRAVGAVEVVNHQHPVARNHRGPGITQVVIAPRPITLAAQGSLWQPVASMKPELLQRITIEGGKCGGHPCIRGKRMRVTDLLELLSAGASFEEILEDYAFLEREDILAAIEYAARQTDHVVLQAS